MWFSRSEEVLTTVMGITSKMNLHAIKQKKQHGRCRRPPKYNVAHSIASLRSVAAERSSEDLAYLNVEKPESKFLKFYSGFASLIGVPLSLIRLKLQWHLRQ